MTIDQDTLEILISRRLDDEITPIEDQLLQETLATDPAAMTLFEQLSRLHRAGQCGIGQQLRQGQPAQSIVRAALQSRSHASTLATLRSWFCSRFTTGLAAGVLIAVTLQMALSRQSVETTEPYASTDVKTHAGPQALPVTRVNGNNRIQRNVDWYRFTDEQGNLWVVEGLREDKVRPAVYDGDL